MADFERAMLFPTLDEQLIRLFSNDDSLDERVFQEEYLPRVVTIHANAQYPNYIFGKVQYLDEIVGVFSYKKENNHFEYAKTSFYHKGVHIGTACAMQSSSPNREKPTIIAEKEEIDKIRMYLAVLQVLQWRPHFEAARENKLLYAIVARDSYVTTFLDKGVVQAGKLLYNAAVIDNIENMGEHALIPLVFDWDKYDYEQRMPWEGALKHTVFSLSYSSSVREEIVKAKSRR